MAPPRLLAPRLPTLRSTPSQKRLVTPMKIINVKVFKNVSSKDTACMKISCLNEQVQYAKTFPRERRVCFSMLFTLSAFILRARKGTSQRNTNTTVDFTAPFQ